jgi:hypothetical protein
MTEEIPESAIVEAIRLLALCAEAVAGSPGQAEATNRMRVAVAEIAATDDLSLGVFYIAAEAAHAAAEQALTRRMGTA